MTTKIPIEQELHSMSYSEICARIHETRRKGNIGALDILAVEIASKLDTFRDNYKQKAKEAKYWHQEYLKALDENI